MPLLPDVPTRAAYRAVFRDDATWMPAARVIAERHGLAVATLRRPDDGSNVVFLTDGGVLKLFAPHNTLEHEAERLLLAHVAGRLPVATPELLAQGELEGWPYLVLSRVAGVPLTRSYRSLDEAARIRVGEQLGALAAAIHALPIGPLPDRWDETHAELRAGCVERRKLQGVGDACLTALVPRLDAIAPARGTPRVLVHADLTGEHLFVDERAKIVSLIDFADALVADPRYEWPSIGTFALESDPAPIRAALLAYGFAPAQLDAELADTLTAFALLHRFGDVRSVPATSARVPRDWPEAVRTLFPIA